MKRWLIVVLAALVLSTAARAADVDALVQKLRSEKAAERTEARTLLVLEGNAALGPLLDLVGDANPTVDREARVALTRLVMEGSAPEVSESRRAGVRQALTARLAATQPLPRRLFALQLLGMTGDADAVAAVAPLLREAATREEARQALTLLPGPAATQALVEALDAAEPQFRAALLAALGRRRAAEALPAVVGRLRDDDAGVRVAALAALARLGSAEAEPALREARAARSPQERAAARTAYLHLANDLIASGSTALAERMLRTALTTAQSPAEASGAAAGLARLPNPPLAVLLPLLETGTPTVAGAVAQALVDAQGAEVTRGLAEASRYARGAFRVALLNLLAERGDALAGSAVREALSDPEEAVRTAAVTALGRLGSFADVPRLAAALGDPGRAPRAAAREALRLMSGTLVTRQLVLLAQQPASEALGLAPADQKAAADARRALVEALADRRDPTALEALVVLGESGEDEVAVTALRAIGRLSYTGVAPERIAAAASKLVTVLKDAAADELRRDAAAQSCVPLAAATRPHDPKAALALYQEVLAHAPDENEVAAALEGIGRFADPALLPLIEPYLTQAPLRAAASAALVPIADTLVKQQKRDEAVALYRTAAKGITDRALLRQVAEKARALGETFDLAGEAGYLTHWFVLGPFAKRADVEKQDVIPVGERVDVTRPVQIGDRSVSWKYVAVDDPTGLLDLEQAIARQDDVAGYAYAEVRCDAPREVVFYFGSDDSAVCWVNGQKVYEFLGDRAYAPDQGEATVQLKAGTNTILLRVGQGSAQWSVSLRVAEKDGTPVRLAQRTNLDEAAARGCLPTWWVLGPFPGQESLKARDAIVVDAIDLQAEVAIGNQTLRWRAARAVNSQGMVDLEQSVAPGGDRGAYAYAEITSDREQEVLLGIGSDDGVVCWVNGQKVHENFAARPFLADQDWAKATLRAGKNTILLKVLQDAGQWAMGVRLTNAEGTPFTLVQEAPGVFTLGPLQEEEPFAARHQLLYYSLCTGFRHDIINYSHGVLKQIGRESGAFKVTVCEDAAKITPEYLAQFDAILLYTTGTPFPTPEAKQALLDFVNGGKAVIGVHSATDTHYDWPEFGALMGAYFDGHPWTQEVGIRVDDPNHPATRMIPEGWKVTDEIYQFRDWSRDKVHMLLSLDNRTVDVNKEGVKRADKDFAVAWCKEVGQGRLFFTSLGHTKEVWDDPIFRQHLLHGILWAVKEE
ncbi:MAG: hypothetical protein GX774_05555 [Armatimonadetes bacterium]|nr:hypothetical protein [Armatimonadota bacterium]